MEKINTRSYHRMDHPQPLGPLGNVLAVDSWPGPHLTHSRRSVSSQLVAASKELTIPQGRKRSRGNYRLGAQLMVATPISLQGPVGLRELRERHGDLAGLL